MKALVWMLWIGFGGGFVGSPPHRVVDTPVGKVCEKTAPETVLNALDQLGAHSHESDDPAVLMSLSIGDLLVADDLIRSGTPGDLDKARKYLGRAYARVIDAAALVDAEEVIASGNVVERKMVEWEELLGIEQTIDAQNKRPPYDPDGEPTGVNGACCINGSCSSLSRSACAAAGGQYWGDGTTCAGIGNCFYVLCCINSQGSYICTPYPAQSCLSSPNKLPSLYTECTVTICGTTRDVCKGACCEADSCHLDHITIGPSQCDGTWKGGASSCDDCTGACCNSLSGVCTVTTDCLCGDQAYETFYGIGTGCDDEEHGHGNCCYMHRTGPETWERACASDVNECWCKSRKYAYIETPPSDPIFDVNHTDCRGSCNFDIDDHHGGCQRVCFGPISEADCNALPGTFSPCPNGANLVWTSCFICAEP